MEFFEQNLILVLLSTTWILLALFAAFGDALVGYIDEWLLVKLRSDSDDHNSDAPGKLILISGFFGFITAIGALIASLIFFDQFTLSVSSYSFFLAFTAGVLEVIWMIPYFHALERGGALNATPLFQTIPIFSLIFGLLFFAEIPTTMHIAATLIIILGAVLLNYTPAIRKIDLFTLSLMLFASAVISIGFFVFKDSALAGNFVATLFGHGIGMGIFSGLIWILWPPYRRQFNRFINSLNIKILSAQLGNESLYAISTAASQLAIVLGPSVMIVTAFNAFHPIFTLLIGIILMAVGSKSHTLDFSGTQKYLKPIAILLIAIGTTLIVLS